MARTILEELVTVFSFDTKGVTKLRQYNSQLNRATTLNPRLASSVRNTNRAIDAQSISLGKAATLLRNYLTAYFAITQGSRPVIAGSNLGGEFELAQVSLESLTGSQEKANSILDKTKQKWRDTGIEATSQISTIKRFISLGLDPATSVALNDSILDVAGSVGLSADETKRLGSALAQVKSKGVVQMEELRQQIAEKGVPAIEELKRKTGLTGEAFFKAIKDGKVSADQLLEIFLNYEGSFNRFRGGAKKLGETLPGLQNRAKAAFMLGFARGLEQMNEVLKPLLKQIIDSEHEIKNVAFAIGEFLIKVIKILSALIEFEKRTTLLSGSLKALVLSFIALSIVKGITTLVTLFGTATGIATVKAWLLNASIMGIPIAVVLAVAALALLLEEIIATFNGGDTITREWLEKWKSHHQESYDFISGIWNLIKNNIENQTLIILAIIRTIIALITGDWENWKIEMLAIGDEFKNNVTQQFEAVKNIVNSLGVDLDGVGAKFKKLVETIKKNPLNIITEGMKGAVNTAGATLSKTAVGAGASILKNATGINRSTSSTSNQFNINVKAPEGVTDGFSFGRGVGQGLSVGSAFENFDNAVAS